jgi:hypothetical protein
MLLRKCNGRIIGLQGQSYYFLNQDSRSWLEASLPKLPLVTWYEPGFDAANDRILLQQGVMENDQLSMELYMVSLSGNGRARIGVERRFAKDKRTFFGATDQNARLNEPGSRRWPGLGPPVIKESEIYIPYSVEGETTFGRNVSQGPFNSGVFHSFDFGETWEVEMISNSQASYSTMCRTAMYWYYLGTSLGTGKGYNLWFSQKKTGGNEWTSPQTLTKDFARAYGRYSATAMDDVVHLCWMDCRHEKWDLNLQAPYRHDYEIAYCYRKDGENRWSKDVILSKGLTYSYSPSMSVERQNLVIAWAGIEEAKKAHSANDPNDIYYVTSNDGGKTWSQLLKVTDGAKDGLTSGEPQVVLQDGVIHLLYTQGRLDLQQISPGLRKLNQPPWPIYYTQRPFPN